MLPFRGLTTGLLLFHLVVSLCVVLELVVPTGVDLPACPNIMGGQLLRGGGRAGFLASVICFALTVRYLCPGPGPGHFSGNSFLCRPANVLFLGVHRRPLLQRNQEGR